MTDDIAERVRKIGGKTIRSMGHIARLQKVSDNDADCQPPRLYPLGERRRRSSLCNGVKIADILDVSLDELAGRTETNDQTAIHNPELHRLYQKVDQLSDEDQKALVILLDSLVKRSRVDQVMAER